MEKKSIKIAIIIEIIIVILLLIIVALLINKNTKSDKPLDSTHKEDNITVKSIKEDNNSIEEKIEVVIDNKSYIKNDNISNNTYNFDAINDPKKINDNVSKTLFLISGDIEIKDVLLDDDSYANEAEINLDFPKEVIRSMQKNIEILNYIISYSETHKNIIKKELIKKAKKEIEKCNKIIKKAEEKIN